MRAQLRLIQTACVVSFVLNNGGGRGVAVSHGESHDVNYSRLAESSSIDKAGAKRRTIADRNVMGISPQFTFLFDSVAKNDSGKNGALDRLKKNVAQEQLAFHAMKEELHATRSKKRNSIKSGISDNGNLVLAKRETNDNNIDDLEQVEASYVARFGDDVNHFDTWEMMRQWYYRGGIDTLDRFCRVAHEKAGMGQPTIRSLKTWPRTVNFRNKKFSAVRADVVMYEIEETGPDGLGENPFFITRGTRPDCAYYLQQWKTDPHRFFLTRHVCGIDVHVGRKVKANFWPTMQSREKIYD